MKRFIVIPILLIGSMLLSACISFSGASVNPESTVNSSIPNTGEEMNTSVPDAFDSSATPFMQPQTGTGTPESGQAATPIPYETPYVESTQTGGESVPNTGVQADAYFKDEQPAEFKLDGQRQCHSRVR